MSKIFFGLYDAAGYLSRLSDGLEDLGDECTYLNLSPDYFSYRQQASSWHLQVHERFHKRLQSRFISIPQILLSRLVLFTQALFSHKVFVFTGYDSFFGFRELGLLRLLGKVTIVIYLGTDARPPYLSGKYLDDNMGVLDLDATHRETKKVKI